ncbi:MAG: transcriptional regulator, partial [Spirochaetaceae bacterium]|nr:transcriptional regulator [Spirochaetaceae bacterium]
LKAVPLELIVGSEGRYRDFNRHFLPRSDHLRSRWVRVDLAHYTDVPLPPVRLYEIGGVYFVRDGNHRVSVAKLRGQAAIDAEVSSLDAELRLTPGMTLEDLKREVLAYEKRSFYERTDFGKHTGYEDLDFTSPGRYDVILEHVLVHKYYVNQARSAEIPFGEALYSWFENVYQPIAAVIEELNLLYRFPGRTVSDLYVYIVKHWDELKRKYGLGFSVADAAKDYGERFGKPRAPRLKALIETLSAFAAELILPLRRRQPSGKKTPKRR